MSVNVGGMKWATCPICGAWFPMVQPGSIAESLKRDGGHIVVLDGDTGACPECGAEITLPVAELLDLDRSDFGRSVLRLADEYRAKGDES